MDAEAQIVKQPNFLNRIGEVFLFGLRATLWKETC